MVAAAQMQTDTIASRPKFTTDYSEVNWPRMATSLGIRLALRVATVDVLKDNVREWRPNYHDRHSFPSRHAVWAYGIGERLAYMFGSYSPWWAFAGQTVANGVGFQRVMDKQHWPGDVLAGAGLGVGLDMIAWGVTNAIFGQENGFPNWKYTVNNNVTMLAVSTGTNFPTRSGWGDYFLGTGLYTDYRLQLPTSDDAGVAVEATLTTAPLKRDGRCAQMLNAIGVMGGGYWHLCFDNSPWAVGAVALAGYQGFLSPRHIDVGNHSFVIKGALNGSVTLTDHLAMGVEAGYNLTSLKIEHTRHTLSSITATFFSVVRF